MIGLWGGRNQNFCRTSAAADASQVNGYRVPTTKKSSCSERSLLVRTAGCQIPRWTVDELKQVFRAQR